MGQEPVAVRLVQEGDHVGVRTDRIRHVEEGESHLRRDVVGHGLRERVDGVLLAQPGLHLLVDPLRGVDGDPDDLKALWIEHDPLQLRDVRGDEVEESRSRHGPDVAPLAAREARPRVISPVTTAGFVSTRAGVPKMGVKS